MSNRRISRPVPSAPQARQRTLDDEELPPWLRGRDSDVPQSQPQPGYAQAPQPHPEWADGWNAQGPAAEMGWQEQESEPAYGARRGVPYAGSENGYGFPAQPGDSGQAFGQGFDQDYGQGYGQGYGGFNDWDDAEPFPPPKSRKRGWFRFFKRR